jgi:hypothetical protein
MRAECGDGNPQHRRPPLAGILLLSGWAATTS